MAAEPCGNNPKLQRKTNNQRYYDFLTGLGNRRKLFEDLQAEENSDCPLSVVMIDVDYFKRYNDIYGHQNGDFILKRISCVLSEESAASGVAFYRYGGEEFTGSACKRCMDAGYRAGIDKVIVSDTRLKELCKEKILVGENGRFGSEEEFCDYLAACVKPYMAHPAFYGVQLFDEPSFDMLESYAKVYSALKISSIPQSV